MCICPVYVPHRARERQRSEGASLGEAAHSHCAAAADVRAFRSGVCVPPGMEGVANALRAPSRAGAYLPAPEAPQAQRAAPPVRVGGSGSSLSGHRCRAARAEPNFSGAIQYSADLLWLMSAFVLDISIIALFGLNMGMNRP